MVTWSIVLLLGAIATIRWLIEPVRRLEAVSYAIAAGDVEARAPATGPAELASLSSNINRMADALIKRSEELNAYLSKNLEARTTELEHANAALAEREERFRSLVQNAADLITVIEADTTVLYQSPSIQSLLGYTPDEIVGRKLSELVHPDDIAQILLFLRDAMSEPEHPASSEARLRHRDGSWRHVEIVGADRRHDPSVAGFVLNTRDVSERKQLEEQLRHQAFHDPLTNVANRARFGDRLEHSLARAKRQAKPVAVIFMDLDNFKSVNDSLGHHTGDSLLVAVAERLREVVRPGDTVARLGGDEFAILLDDATLEEAERVAQRILQRLRTPYHLAERDMVIGASLGIAIGEADVTDADTLLRNADVAMYVAKDHGKGRYEVYEHKMHSTMIERLELLGDLHHALEHGEFVVHYQPTVVLRTGDIVGMEALVRWRHPKRGLLLPEQFIQLAEETGLIIPLGRWVLEEACRRMQDWHTRYPSDPPWTIAVNVSPRQLQQATFVEDVAEVLRTSGLTATSLILEITETSMMADVASTMPRLTQLHELGVRIAIDDFGTGYSSLSYLRQFPVDIIKIDKSFVTTAEDRGTQRELARTIVELGRSLGVDIVAEGIEDSDALADLQSLDCDLGQGYYFARPVEPEEIEALLRNKRQAA